MQFNEAEIKNELTAFENWLERNTTLKQKSREQYILQTNLYLNDTELNELSVENVKKFLIKKYSLRQRRNTVYNRRFAIKKYLLFKRKDAWFTELESSFKQIKLLSREYQKEIKFSELKRFLAYLINKNQRKLTLALMILWDTSMRVSPVINLKVKDIKTDSQGRYISAIEKGGKRTERYLDKSTINVLNRFISDKGSNEYVFRERKGNRWETWWECYYRMWKTLKTESKNFFGFGYGISFHWLRISRAVDLYNKYHDILKVKGMLGHSDIRTTLRYIEESRFNSSQIIEEEEGKWE